MRRGRRKSSGVNPFISLTDVLFNVLLVFIFASAIFAQDISRKYAENKSFQEKLDALQLERDALLTNVQALTVQLGAASDEKMSLEDQIKTLVGNLDAAQLRQDDLENRISLIVGDLNSADAQNRFLQDKITVVLGDIEGLETANKLLEDKMTIVLGDLTESEQQALLLRSQVAELSRNNFLVVELEWLTESHDLDLHIVDPAGNRFYWGRPTYPDSTARLTLDNRIGARPNKPGLEIWTAKDIQLGTYRIEVGLWGCGRTSDSDGYKPCQSDAVASVLVRDRDSDTPVSEIRIPATQNYARGGNPEQALNEESLAQLITVAEVEVFEEDGEVKVVVKPTL
jgi:biopolymer transport protein ExbD